MSDEVEVIESVASPEVQAEASKIGWQPPERFKGKPEDFVDADVYMEKAQTVLPILRESQRKLTGDIADLRARLESEVTKSSTLAKRLEDIDLEHSTRLAKEFKRAKEEAQAELEAALEAGDHKASARLTREVAALERIEDEPKKKEIKTENVPDPEVERQLARMKVEFESWANETDYPKWSPRERAEFRLIGEELRAEGNKNQGIAFLNDILPHMKRENVAAKESKVEAGKNGSGSSRGGKKSGYEALTPEERGACDADQRQFVGPGKRFAKIEDYRAHWAKVYQEQ